MANEINFREGITRLFNKTNTELNEVESELITFQSIVKDTSAEFITPKNINKFHEVVTAMMLSSENTRKTFEQMQHICLAAIAKTTSDSTKKEISLIIEKLKAVGKYDFTQAERLPFTLESGAEGWQAGGDIGAIRRLVNFTGHILVTPVMWVVDSKIRPSDYYSYLYKIEEALKWNKRTIADQNYSSNNPDKQKAKEEITKALEDIKIFIKTFRTVAGRYRTTQRDILKILKKNKEYNELKVDLSNIVNRDTHRFFKQAA